MHTARMLGIGPLALVLLALATGCQRPTTYSPVSGKVTFRGIALTNGIIVFTPDSSRGESGKVALGAIGADGSYTLNADETQGVPAGWYRVTVAAFAGPPRERTPGQPPPTSLLPEKYRDPQQSMLTCEVKANRMNTIDFNLD